MINVNSILPITNLNLLYVPFYDMLYTIPTFKGGFKKLIFKYKFIILITYIKTKLSQINLNIYKYDLDSDAILSAMPYFAISSLYSTPSLSACTYTFFVNMIIKIVSTSKKVTKELKTKFSNNGSKKQQNFCKIPSFFYRHLRWILKIPL